MYGRLGAMDRESYENIKASLITYWEAGKTFDEVLRIVAKEYPKVYKGFICCMLQVLRQHNPAFRY